LSGTIRTAARPPFLVRLRLAAARPWLIHLTLGPITAAAAWAYASNTLLLTPAFQPMIDFGVYYRAAADLNAHLDPYLRYDHNLPFSISLGYVYPPFLARLLQPLALLSYSEAKLLALIVLQLAILASVLLTWRLLQARTWTLRLFILDLFLLSSGLAADVQLGQVNVLLMPLTLAWVLAYTRRSALAWVLVGLSVGLKLQQAPLFALALIRRELRGLSLGLLTLAATIVIGGLTLSFEFFTTVLPRLTSTVPTGAENTSLLADFERLLHPGADKFLPVDPTYPEAHFLLALIILAVLALTARALYRLQDRYLEALVALAAVPMLSNYLGAGHLLPMFPIGLLLAACTWRLHSYRLFALLAFSLFLLADYPRLYMLGAAFDPLISRALFYEIGPGLAALCLWLVSLRLATLAKAAHPPLHWSLSSS